MIGDHDYATLTPEICYNRLRLCDVHFEDKYFASCKKLRLTNDAIPNLIVNETPEETFQRQNPVGSTVVEDLSQQSPPHNQSQATCSTLFEGTYL